MHANKVYFPNPLLQLPLYEVTFFQLMLTGNDSCFDFKDIQNINKLKEDQKWIVGPVHGLGMCLG